MEALTLCVAIQRLHHHGANNTIPEGIGTGDGVAAKAMWPPLAIWCGSAGASSLALRLAEPGPYRASTQVLFSSSFS